MITKLLWLRWFLLPLGLLHLGIVRLRNGAYDVGILSGRELPIPVISVGNIQAGGTGKTPLTLFLIRVLQKKGLRVGVLSRGYGRQTSGTLVFVRGGEVEPTPAAAGDEPMELWQAIDNGGMGIGADRYEAGMALLKACKPDCLLLDDGMQHRRLKRNLDICTIDVSRWFRHPFLLPFSYLRDSKSRLADASVLLMSKWEEQPERFALVEKDLARYGKADTIVQKISYTLMQPESPDGKELKRDAKRVGVFTGIANPGHFTHSLQNAGYDVVLKRYFPDHHSYKLTELQAAAAAAAKRDVDLLLITEKDAVKIRPILSGSKALAGIFAVVAAEVTPENSGAIIDAVMSVVGRQ